MAAASANLASLVVDEGAEEDTVELEEAVSDAYCLEEYGTADVGRAMNGLMKRNSSLVRGAVLSPVVNLTYGQNRKEGERTHLTGYAMGLRPDAKLTTQFFEDVCGGVDAQRSPLAATLAVYDVVELVPDKEIRKFLPSLRNMFARADREANAKRKGGVRLSSGSDGDENDVLATDAYPLNDTQYVSITKCRMVRGEDKLHMVVRTALPGVSRDVANVAVKLSMSVNDLLESPQWERAKEINRTYNRRVASVAAKALNLKLSEELSSSFPGREIATPITTWLSNVFDTSSVAVAAPGLAEDAAGNLEAVIKRGTTLSDQTSTERLPVFYQRTHNVARSQGALVAMGPTAGFEWFYGPSETAPTAGSKAVYGGHWENEASAGIFPVGGGRPMRWSSARASEMSAEQKERMAKRLAVAGSASAVTRRAGSVYTETLTEEFKDVVERLGWKSNQGRLQMDTVACFMGAPPSDETNSVSYMLAWADEGRTRLDVAMTDAVVAEIPRAYAEAKKGPPDTPLAKAFGAQDLGMVLSQESQDHQFLTLNRTLVEVLHERVLARGDA